MWKVSENIVWEDLERLDVASFSKRPKKEMLSSFVSSLVVRSKIRVQLFHFKTTRNKKSWLIVIMKPFTVE